jgi:DNA-binding transcriptional LysR family regulator
MLDVRRLRMLREVSLHGTIRAAARSLSFTPSAVSQQLSALERDLGVELLERRGRSVHLTPAALVLVARTEEILVRLAAAEAEAKAIASATEAPVRIASFPSAAATIVADAVRENGIEVHILEADPQLGLARVRAGEVDIAILWEYDFVPIEPGAGIELVPLLDDPIQVVLPASHAAAAAPALDLADLAGEAWIDSTSLSSCHPFMRRACNAAGFEPRVAAETNDHRTLHHLIASGVGLSLIPVLSQLDLPAALVARPIRTNPPKRRIHAAFRSSSAGDTRVGRLLERLDAAAKSRPAALDLVRAGK